MVKIYLTMPQPGETITEGTIVKWLTAPGKTVEEGEAIAELETEKAVFEYESPFQGTVVKLVQTQGKRVPVAEPIAVMEVAQDKAKIYDMMGIAKFVDAAPRETEQGPPKQDKTGLSPVAREAAPAGRAVAGDLTMSPHVRRQAGEHKLSTQILHSLADGSGRVTAEAIEKYLGGAAASKREAVPGIDTHLKDYTAQTCTAIRRRIADNMVLSVRTIPHAHTGLAVDVTAVVSYREQHKEAFKKKLAAPLNFLSLLYPALVKAITNNPLVNASFHDAGDASEIRVFNKINLGVAVGTEHGLVIPVIHDMAGLSFTEFNRQLNDKIRRAQAKKLMPEDFQGATLTFNNFGYFGTSFGVQIIQPPLSATLGMGAIERKALVGKKDEIVVRSLVNFVLSFDHRVLDGREAGLFLTTLKKEIETLTFAHVK